MNNSCDVIKDLLPLYHDGVCSDDSKKIVEKHLENCTECRNYLDGISKAVLNYKQPKEEEARIKSLIKLRQKSRIRNIIILAVSIVCAVILFVTIYGFVKWHEFTVEYKDNIFSPEKDYAASDILGNSDYYCTHMIFKDVDGKLGVYMYYTNVLWDKYAGASRERRYNNEPFYMYVDPVEAENLIMNMNPDELDMMIETVFYESISSIYYFAGDYEKLAEMSDDEFIRATQDAVLIWEK